MIQICFLWHMHQPDYRDAKSGISQMPWVRLHATRGYYDMAKALLAAPPGVCATINFAPSLIEQLVDLQEDRRDRFTSIAYQDTSTLSFAERCLILRHFFSVSRDHGVNPRPRYLELLVKRDETSIEEAAARFSDQEIRDLVSLFYLSWIGWAAREEHPRLSMLEAKGHNFSEADKREIVATGDRIAKKILPLYRELQHQHKIEISVTPYAHPILPLIYDSDCAHVARPDLPLPARFAFPQDAAWHVNEAKRVYREVFHTEPRGMWPAEGSISPQVIPLFVDAGLQWIASDEGVLLRSLDDSRSREEAMTLPWRLHGSSLDLVFRDRDLSDRIGFWYSKMSPSAAAEDFLSQISSIEAKLPQQETRALFIILDGENPWENYPDSGRGFLSLVYQALAHRCVGIAQALSQKTLARGELTRLHSGSWIEASFRIWIGGEADNRAWNLLRTTRIALEAARTACSPDAIARAERHMHIAQGSDWFWWFGDDFGSQEKIFFDSLFRGRLLAVYHAIEQAPPDNLLIPVEQQLHTLEVRPPLVSISPSLDGRHSSLSAWHGAGEIVVGYGRSAMYSAVEPLERILFSLDGDFLLLRLHIARSVWEPENFVVLCFSSGEEIYLSSAGFEAFIFHEVIEAKISHRQRTPFFLKVHRGVHVVGRYPAQGSVLL